MRTFFTQLKLGVKEMGTCPASAKSDFSIREVADMPKIGQNRRNCVMVRRSQGREWKETCYVWAGELLCQAGAR